MGLGGVFLVAVGVGLASLWPEKSWFWVGFVGQGTQVLRAMFLFACVFACLLVC